MTSAYIPPQEPQFVGISPSSLCQLGPRPLIITGILRHLLTQHFIAADTIEDPALRSTLWTSDDTTGIVIESITRWRPDVYASRPAIVLKRNTYRQVRLAIDNRLQAVAGCVNGVDRYLVAWQGSHVLFCVTNEGAAAEILAAEVQRELGQFGPKIRSSLGLLRFECVEIGEIYELEEAKEHFVVPVTVGYAYEEKWQLRAETNPLQGISLRMLLEP